MKSALRDRRQRGAAALLVTALLFLTLLVVVAATQRQVLVEVGSSLGQQRSTQAFEAAEAGLEWAVARLNDDTRLGDDCLPSSAVDAASFRDRHLPLDLSLGRRRAATWDDAGTPRLLQAVCVHGDAGWTCSCPASGPPSPAAGDVPAPAFAVVFGEGPRPDVFTAVASGCLQGRTPCADTAASKHEAAARLEVAV
ncbi:MAG TPA: PilX N-terminal domain-containing pilus assembly protein, partial [Caldimonas sp.]|nr:PilX N-terminal domain-containing pilus assembly protein [Caldimonas sp.]